ncbi:hypothetical protein [Pedobacter nyackensis]|uniref:hypothetical protein n=1 Tax=Pedobacter nyackensis TaxID=475255 RepID=UPI00292F07B7|nr:hypothetical protein [Pedobacter nyackensis]
MESKTLTIEISISTAAGKQMPQDQEIYDVIIDHLYDFIIKDAAIVDGVHITKVNGQSTEEGE